ncbi:helix-turn-helix transcriptional regulator [Providencia huaxiensis]|uniref:Helix-turn-helix transcriptional regulator n=1 Tax=Providencia huaxiensis TaxID=2027290 RepID=A0A8I2IN58_9GAMM|nr:MULTISPECIES: helix-turn-helix transcriptional regulator [Providencia]MBN6361916.1 helix-turn-helix transcriptional regulator [Providencia huaxiensis]MBQ0269342.1 helix-turn-helix transcriptional regulator [Providencia huaxiensis]MBQ0533640.1 helix-turn-helix transcriptional regulator [Providencia huaxiensis]MBQ0589135.1 helix-turn-helix transcriptional regulator [Providencia huaxiensis]MDI7239864.1 helix-turn-helix transcriptional regulator [Providencia huaxiensis]
MKKNTSKIVGARIRSLRKDQNMSIQQLSTLLGISQQHQSRHELGEIRIHVDTLYSISQILELDIQELIIDFAIPIPVSKMDSKQNRRKILQAESLLSPEHNFNLYK